MSFAIFVGEYVTTLVRTAEFTHVEYVAHLARYFHLFELLLAQRASSVAYEPSVETAATEKSLTLIA